MNEQSIMMQACRGQRTRPYPVWLMRQAGRYMKSYRKVREKYTFIEICKTPEIATEVTLQPVNELGVDAAIIFADILLVPESMGMQLNFSQDGSSPLFPYPLQNQADIDKLQIPNPNISNKYLMDAIQLVRSRLNANIPLIGFSGAPWTLAAFMIEGQPGKELHRAKSLIYLEPELLVALLNKITESVKLYLEAQINAGANIIQIFDSLAGHLSANDFLTFSLPFMKDIITYLKSKFGTRIPIIIFARGASHSLHEIMNTGCDVISIDWTLSIKEAASITHHAIPLQGNLDPVIMLAVPEIVAKHAQQIIQDASSLNGFIFNLGHGILPNTPEENVRFLIDFVKRSS